MQTLIKEFAVNGTKTEPEIDEEVGWQANDQPAAEDWNFIQNERDKQQITDADARAVREFGVNPSIMRGNYGNRVPALRPNAFADDGRLWDPENDYNMADISASSISDASCGWDPSLGMPVIALMHPMLLPATSVNVEFIHCHDYENAPVSKTTRTLNFGFTTSSIARNDLPILICDGYLYLIVEKTTTLNRVILRYDLSSWTGDPDKTLDVGDHVALGRMFVTELVELAYIEPGEDEIWSNMHCGFFAQRYTDGGIYFCRFRKDLETFDSSATPLAGITTLDRLCRTDGETVYTAGKESTTGYNYHRLIGALASTVDTPIEKSLGFSTENQKIVDILPLQPDAGAETGFASAAVLVHRATAPYGPYIFTVMGPPCNGDLTAVHSLTYDNLQFDWTKPGCFVAFGAMLFAVLVRVHEADYPGYYTQLAKIDPTKLLGVWPPTPACNQEGTGPYVGEALDSEYVESSLTVRAFHDGRAVWVVDFSMPSARRVVAPGRN